jgi:hypothetical protein
MPLYNWEKCTQGFINYVSKDLKSSRLDVLIWEKLYNQYLDRFGLGNEFERYLNSKLNLAKMRFEYVKSGDRNLITPISIAEIEVKDLDPHKHEGMTIDQCLVYLNKWGLNLNKRTSTIVEFKNAMNEYGKANK